MSDFVNVDTRDGILHLEMNRPEKMNALDLGMYRAMADAIEGANHDDSVRVILITGAGDAFCSGNDLKDFMQNPPRDESFPAFVFIRALVDAEKPLVAAVNGLAVGIGTTMLLHCDLVLASREAKFSLPFVHLGLCLEAGASLLLPKLCGHQQAAELTLLGEPFDVSRAERIVLVNRVVEREALRETALEQVARLASLPANAVQATRQLLKAPLRDPVHRAVQDEIRNFIALLEQPAAQHKLSAFLDR